MDFLKSMAWTGAGLGWAAMGLWHTAWNYLRADTDVTFNTSMVFVWVVLIVVWVFLLRAKLKLAREFDFGTKAEHDLERMGYSRNFPFNKLDSNG